MVSVRTSNILSFPAPAIAHPDRPRRPAARGCYYFRMLTSLKTKARRTLTVAVALTPWLASMYLFYWLDASGTWTSETPHRGKLSVALLASGMGLSFLIHSYFAKRDQK